MRRLKILTWHVHGSYLYYLGHAPHDFYLPVKSGRPEGYGGRCGDTAWPDSLHDVAAESVRDLDFDCVIFQSRKNYLADRFEILSPRQRELPGIYLEHDPPREHPTDTRHPAADTGLLLVHVTHFNALMWDNGSTATTVIEHGVRDPEGVRCTGDKPRGLVVVNGMARRGRRVGADLFLRARRHVPLDLVGMGSEELGGLGEIPHHRLAEFQAPYRFFFNPIRYTSLGLAVCEAMMLGMPILGLATTEMATVVENGVSGYVDTSLDSLIESMSRLVEDRDEARRLGDSARRAARQRFSLERFVGDWNRALARAVDGHGGGSPLQQPEDQQRCDVLP